MRMEREWTGKTRWVLAWSLLSSADGRYYVHYGSGNFAIRAGAYFSEFVKTDLILKHLYAHNLGKKCPINHALGIKLRSRPALFISRRRTKSKACAGARVSRKKIAISGFIRRGARAVDSSRPFSIEPIFLLHNSRGQLRGGKRDSWLSLRRYKIHFPSVLRILI